MSPSGCIGHQGPGRTATSALIVELPPVVRTSRLSPGWLALISNVECTTDNDGGQVRFAPKLLAVARWPGNIAATIRSHHRRHCRCSSLSRHVTYLSINNCILSRNKSAVFREDAILLMRVVTCFGNVTIPLGWHGSNISTKNKESTVATAY